ncbi:hypothetical protein ACK32R_04875 [Aeromonas dhakensis]|jgi:hypothetical protein|uniref:hypothetical protein n=1 Tax=Aeromonas dhakensis TaxID=196024 RepID=UPI0039873693
MSFIGLMVILFATALLVRVVADVGVDPEFVAAVSKYSPWVAENAVVLGWVAAGMVFVAGMMIPVVLTRKEAIDGVDRLGVIGSVFGNLSLVYVFITMAIPALGYLLGVGFFAAQQ